MPIGNGTDESLIVDGICACISTMTDVIDADLDTIHNDLVDINTKLDTLQTYLNDMFGTTADLSDGLSFMKQFLTVVGDQTVDWLPSHSEISLLRAAIHTHNRHFHPEDVFHNAGDWSEDPLGNQFGPDNPIHGAFPSPFAEPFAAALISEFFMSQDLDGGGGAGNSIYGHTAGFQISVADPDFPVGLQGVHNHPDFGSPSNVLTWADYLATVIT